MSKRFSSAAELLAAAGTDLGTTPVFNWLLWGYGVPAAAFRIHSQPPPLVPPRSTPYKAIRTPNTP